ncbi:allantoicase [Afifella pfennigii]|uniref:allantoicase n=1 Tax=Afifella pfennigii TaxID=209897 RepID=UPI00047C6B7B|nr:allantoicase [Afifella pfennigii]
MSGRFIPSKPSPEAEALAVRYIDLAHPRLGSKVTQVSDEFFAPRERLIDPKPPVFLPDVYDENGKWMDGWETRRRRAPGHDFAVLRLGTRGRIRALDIDTSFFTGNFPPEATIEAATVEEEPGEADWQALVPPMRLAGDSHHIVAVDDPRAFRWLRLCISPDGGIARLRVFGEVAMDWAAVSPDEEIDLAALVHGGRALCWSDAHYGHPSNMLAPGRGANMGDGWETARRRGPGNDFAVIALGAPGSVARVEIDTAHFKGNYPDRAALRAALLTEAPDPELLAAQSARWPVLMAEEKLGPDAVHRLERLAELGPVSHVRFDIFPDGGVSRLRLIGRKAP